MCPTPAARLRRVAAGGRTAVIVGRAGVRRSSPNGARTPCRARVSRRHARRLSYMPPEPTPDGSAIDPTVPPSGPGCVECEQSGRAGGCTCAGAPSCGHVGCCDTSPCSTPPSTTRRPATRHRVLRARRGVVLGLRLDRLHLGPRLADPQHHPVAQDVPGPRGPRTGGLGAVRQRLRPASGCDQICRLRRAWVPAVGPWVDPGDRTLAAHGDHGPCPPTGRKSWPERRRCGVVGAKAQAPGHAQPPTSSNHEGAAPPCPPGTDAAHAGRRSRPKPRRRRQ